MRTSPSPGPSRSSSMISNGLPASKSTAAVVFTRISYLDARAPGPVLLDVDSCSSLARLLRPCQGRPPSRASLAGLRRVGLEVGGEQAAPFVDRGVVASRRSLERDIENAIADLEGKLQDEPRRIGPDQFSFDEEAPESLCP